MWRWCGRRQLAGKRELEESVIALKQLWKTPLIAEVCQQTSTPGTKYSFLDLPDQLGNWWRVKPTGHARSIRVLSRSCYGLLFDEIYRHNTETLKKALELGFGGGIVLLGTPGIGKTGFLLYSLWKLLQKEERIVLKLPQLQPYFCFTWKEKELVIQVAGSGVEAVEVAGRRCWYLADRRVREEDWLLKCKFLLACSPDKANYSEFAKSGTVEMMYDPIWSLDELLALNEHGFGHPVEDVKARYAMWGGIPRYVLQKLDTVSQMEVIKAVGLVTQVDDIFKLARLPQDQSHKVLHMVVGENFRSYGLGLASRYVEEMIFASLPTGELQQFINSKQCGVIRDIQGKLFEAFVAGQIARGGMVSYRELDSMGEFGAVHEVMLPPLRRTARISGVVFPDKCDNDTLYAPVLSSNDAEWDFIMHGGVYEVTVAAKRPLVLGPALEDALSFLSDAHSVSDKHLAFCFIVPQFLLHDFKIAWIDLNRKGAKSRASVDDVEEVAVGEAAEKRKAEAAEAIMERKAEAAGRIKELNISVKVVSFENTGLCPRCNGAGVTDGGVEAVARLFRAGLSSVRNIVRRGGQAPATD